MCLLLHGLFMILALKLLNRTMNSSGVMSSQLLRSLPTLFAQGMDQVGTCLLLYTLEEFSLRTVDNHTVLGQTSLPRSINLLLASALRDAPIPTDKAAATLELIRVSANFCIDNSQF